MGGKLGVDTILGSLLPHPLPAPFIHARVTDHTKQEVPTLDLPSGSSSCPRISLNSNVFRQHPGCKKRLCIPSVSHIHTHSDSALAVLAVDGALGVLSCILSLLCPFFQSLYLTSLALKGISQVRAPVSARSLRLHQRFWSLRMDLRESVSLRNRLRRRHLDPCVLFFFFTASSRISEQV